MSVETYLIYLLVLLATTGTVILTAIAFDIIRSIFF